MNRLSMTLQMLELLQVNEYMKKEELAKCLRTNVRNIIYLKKELEIAGFQIKSFAGRNGGYKLDSSKLLILPDFSELEKDRLLYLYKYVSENETIPDQDDCRRIMLKIINHANCNKVSELSIDQGFRPVYDKYGLTEIYQKIQEAMSSNNVIKISYRKSNGNINEYKVEPYQFHQYRNVWYLYGIVKEEMRMFKLNRIIHISITHIPYSIKECHSKKINKKFSLDKIHLCLKIQNRPDIGEFVYGENQLITHISDDECLLEVDIIGDYIAKSFVLSFGKNCEVLEPSYLRDEIRNECKVLYEKYKLK